jgi:hypothetical protein
MYQPLGGDASVAEALWDVHDTVDDVWTHRLMNVSGGGSTFGSTYSVPAYFLGGLQSVEVLEVPAPVKLTGPTAVTRGDSVTFTAQLTGGYPRRTQDGSTLPGQTGPFWYFYRYDTTAVYDPNRSYAYDEVSSCRGQMTCRMRADVPGRMHTTTFVATRRVYSTSDAMTFGLPPEPSLACNGQADHVEIVRAETVHCEVKPGRPQDSVTVAWSFNGAGRTDGNPAALTGAGTMVQSGRVEARMTNSGSPAVTRRHVDVEVRARTWAELRVPGIIRHVEIEPLTMADYPPDGTAFGRHILGYLALDSMPMARVPSGPNTGLFYVAGPVQLLPSNIYLHPALYMDGLPPELGPQSPGYNDWLFWYSDQNGKGSGTCRAADVVRFRNNIERHEGVSMADNSHVGVANRVFEEQHFESRFEKLVSTTDSTDLKYRVNAEFLRLTGEESVYQHAEAKFDTVDTPIVKHIGCSIDNNRDDQ